MLFVVIKYFSSLYCLYCDNIIGISMFKLYLNTLLLKMIQCELYISVPIAIL